MKNIQKLSLVVITALFLILSIGCFLFFLEEPSKAPSDLQSKSLNPASKLPKISLSERKRSPKKEEPHPLNASKPSRQEPLLDLGIASINSEVNPALSLDPTSFGSIRGQVLNKNGQALEGLKISLTNNGSLIYFDKNGIVAVVSTVGGTDRNPGDSVKRWDKKFGNQRLKSPSTRTDSEGRFEFNKVRQAYQFLRIEGQSHYLDESVVIQWLTKHDTDMGIIYLTEGGQVTVGVSSSQQEVIPGAKVCLISEDVVRENELEEELKEDPETICGLFGVVKRTSRFGKRHFSQLPVGDYFLVATKPSYRPSRIESIRVFAGEKNAYRLTLKDPCSSQVRVIDQAGKAVEKAYIWVSRDQVEDPKGLPSLTDKNGVARLSSGLNRGFIRVITPQNERAHKYFSSIENSPKLVTIRVPRHYTVRGQLLSRDRRTLRSPTLKLTPVLNVQNSAPRARQQVVQVAKSGRYQFQAAEGRYTLSTHVDNHKVYKEVVLVSGGDSLIDLGVIQLDPFPRFSVIVKGPSGPLSDHLVKLFSRNNSDQRVHGYSIIDKRTNEKGQVTLDSYPSGVYDLVVFDNLRNIQAVTKLRVSAGMKPFEVNCPQRTARLELHLLDAQGKPLDIDAIRLSFEGSEFIDFGPARLRPGVLRYANLLPGTYKLRYLPTEIPRFRWQHDSLLKGRLDKSSVKVKAGETKRLTVTLVH